MKKTRYTSTDTEQEDVAHKDNCTDVVLTRRWRVRGPIVDEKKRMETKTHVEGSEERQKMRRLGYV